MLEKIQIRSPPVKKLTWRLCKIYGRDLAAATTNPGEAVGIMQHNRSVSQEPN